MSPVLTSTLTLAGVIAAALPLLWLTAPAPPQEPPTTQQQPAEQQDVYATLTFSGAPSVIILRHNGTTLKEWHTPTAPADTTLSLPAADTIELEAEATWPADASGQNAITITLEPADKESRSSTRWGDSVLHDIFTFTW